MTDEHDEIPFFPYFLDDRPRADEPAVADAPLPLPPGSGYARGLGDGDDSVPVAYVAWEENGLVVGWLWWNDERNALWKVSNYYEPAARIRNGVDVAAEPPWLPELQASFEEGLTPGRAIQRLMSEAEDAEGRCVPPQDPQRARSLAHLREIAGELDWAAARVRFRAGGGAGAGAGAGAGLASAAELAPAAAAGLGLAPAPAPRDEPALAPSDELLPEPNDAPESAGEPEPAVDPKHHPEGTPAAEPEPDAETTPAAAPRRRGWLARLFGRR